MQNRVSEALKSGLMVFRNNFTEKGALYLSFLNDWPVF